MTIEVGHNGSNRRTQSTMESKETSTRGIDEGQKLLSGTEEELIEDLQRVHKLCPNTEPDRDFYRAHGKFADAAWEEHFSHFKVFVAEAGLLPPGRQAIYSLARAVEVLQLTGKDLSAQEAAMIREEVNEVTNAFSMLMAERESQRAADAATFEAMAEEARIKAEECERAGETALRDSQRANAAAFELMAEEARIKAERYKRAALRCIDRRST